MCYNIRIQWNPGKFSSTSIFAFTLKCIFKMCSFILHVYIFPIVHITPCLKISPQRKCERKGLGQQRDETVPFYSTFYTSSYVIFGEIVAVGVHHGDEIPIKLI